MPDMPIHNRLRQQVVDGFGHLKWTILVALLALVGYNIIHKVIFVPSDDRSLPVFQFNEDLTGAQYETKIANGFQVPANDPAIASICSLQNKTGHHLCGAVIVGNDTAITTAHCFFNHTATSINGSPVPLPPTGFMLRCGSHKYTQDGVLVPLDRVLIYPNYTHQQNSTASQFDLALIRVHFPPNAPVRPVAISNVTDCAQLSGWFSAYGWGQTAQDGPNSVRLRKATMKIFESCLPELPGIFLANVKGPDTCAGDSGSPALQLGQLIGLTLSGSACGEEETDSFFIWIAHYEPWFNSPAVQALLDSLPKEPLPKSTLSILDWLENVAKTFSFFNNSFWIIFGIVLVVVVIPLIGAAWWFGPTVLVTQLWRIICKMMYK